MLRFPILFLLLLSVPQAQGQQYRLDTLVASPATNQPVCLAFSPDSSGKFFFTEKTTGRVRVVENSVLVNTPFLTVSVTESGEQGLLGITLHPRYPDTPYVYIFYTRSTVGGGTRDNMVVRYRDSSGVGIRPDTIVVVPRTNTATNHNGGNIHFGPDEKLYVTFGEYATTANSQDTASTNLRGKILRLNPDGSIPSDNPYPGKPFWSIGHRNSFDFTFDRLTGKMYCSENGPNCNDEINLVPRQGNLGWPVDGNCSYTGNPLYVRPLYYFPSNLPALTGLVVYRGAAFPRLRGKILFAGNSTPSIWTVTLSASGDTILPGSFGTFFTYASGFADLEIGPDGYIYITNGPYTSHRILRLRPVAPAFASTPPLAARQDSVYSYMPTFTGTPPSIELVSAPQGMEVDSTTWTVRWTPTNAQALLGSADVHLRASNGAGVVDQLFTVVVTNVNDPPSAFDLAAPPNDTTLTFIGNDPVVSFQWQSSSDPDLDTLLYTVHIDTVSTFDSPARQDTLAGASTLLTKVFPRQTRNYFWRVAVSDGEDTVLSTTTRRVIISFTTPVLQPSTTPSKEAKLEQNYPNPFNPATSIKYTLPRSGWVRLSIFNLLGQEVALIFDGEQKSGAHEVEFTSTDLPSGIYFYRLQAPGFVETKKMVVAK